MNKFDFRYRKNLGLLLAFLLLVTTLFVVSGFLARNMTVNFVETDFNNRKVEVFDESIKPFNEFFSTKIPEVSYFQGYIDSTQASGLSSSVLRQFPFVDKIVFFDIIFTNKDSLTKGVKFNNLVISSKSSYDYYLNKDNKLISERQNIDEYRSYSDEFNNMVLKLVGYLDRVTDSIRLTDNEIYKVFYSVQPGKITYMNIPRISDLVAYKAMMGEANLPKSTYEQDMFVFSINPTKIKIVNKYPNLYEDIYIKPIVEQGVMESEPYLSTELPLPGALSDYKLQFDTSREYIRREVNKRFFPVIAALSALYLIMLSIGYLIYRNVMINSKLYQLQYDFINNLTHEFKTPVSVIKIAGNNIKSAENLSVKEREMYGRILDQEADKLNSLMNKLLSFAQIENKSMKFNGEYIDVKEFCERVFDAFKLKYSDLKLNYSIEVESELYADPVLLNSVFQNLIDNAYKYSPVDRKVLEVVVQQNKKNFVITFEDKGIGIDKKEFNSIFKKFYRVKNQFNQQGSIGLGLAFCKEITEFMGGEIKVESQLGIGTIFTLTFPLDVKKL
ncbi:HAMP domain-containing histidine kinase [Sphingobacterium olei]|uniref:histidine kinase n=1 Tax=Sphingobacterium olei TaxID=2571155 RepID=A0A4U0P2A9_9SPHI|nr:HAMP domain-containing sensor histidine kinase [Sphingobacterium olei]TJZ61427.1 HAMP domain-containing histidine kinase [Sphingobacterium olei]